VTADGKSEVDPPTADSLQEANFQRLQGILYQILGVIEIVIQPVVGLLLLTGIEMFFAPIPYLALDPFSFNFAGNGVMITQFMKGIIMLTLLNDLYYLYQNDRSVTSFKGVSDD